MRSPSAGEVIVLPGISIGAEVTAGMPLVEIVPLNDSLSVTAFFDSSNVRFNLLYLETKIEVDSLPADQFGLMSGVIRKFSANSINDGFGGRAFVADILVEEAGIPQTFPRTSVLIGHSVVVRVSSGRRSIASYMIDPIRRAILSSN